MQHFGTYVKHVRKTLPTKIGMEARLCNFGLVCVSFSQTQRKTPVHRPLRWHTVHETPHLRRFCRWLPILERIKYSCIYIHVFAKKYTYKIYIMSFCRFIRKIQILWVQKSLRFKIPGYIYKRQDIYLSSQAPAEKQSHTNTN